ncbi:carboxymuconolactone decarboxylase family protein [Amycolatopsis rhizosphaerae]|uniref:Carboxymuconolactone decarboxylase family protein n=1 Tax=Amycolatopsis rhizosphaerae TaxID=2053003 RepID=A0A558BWR8_9PSEU|nr:carboxymuconolactone decarboxylase family protein [Amycolatopsis rhizosphaerae]TVT40964.1 carboxymuconolactone decarboxylase family protein [Amycolatopsis rhizosphaerae]
MFTDHTLESAPAASRRFMQGTADHLGYLPAATRRWAASPHLLEGFGKLNVLFETTTLDPLAREVVILTVATRNACHLCVAMHTAKLTKLGAAEELISALRERRPLADERLDAVRVLTLRILDTAGAVDDTALQAFFAHGYTRQHALEIVLGIGTYTMSTLANALVQAPVDEQLEPYAWYRHAA